MIVDCRIENCLKCSDSEVFCLECEVSFTLDSMNTTCLRKTESWSAGFTSMVIGMYMKGINKDLDNALGSNLDNSVNT